jgi:hypothetical protein
MDNEYQIGKDVGKLNERQDQMNESYQTLLKIVNNLQNRVLKLEKEILK